MKTVITLLIVLISSIFVNGQGCQNPIDQNIFQSGFNKIAIQQTNKQKFEEARAFMAGKCFTAAQVKTLAQLIADDLYRLEFCKSAYAATSDSDNFYDVYDAFQSRSFAFRLHDYVLSFRQLATTAPTNPPTPVKTNTTAVAISFPRLVYPVSTNYVGMKGCQGPVINNTEFMRLAENVVAQPTDEAKELAIVTATESYCLDFAQVMKLTSLVQPERNRLRILTKTLAAVYDQEAYKAGAALLTTKPTQTEWLNYGSAYLTPAPAICEETDAQFTQSLKSIQAKTFDRERIELINVMARDHCFSVAQIKKIVGQLYAGSGKVEVLKALYDKCPDKKNYYTLSDELTFGSEKDDLMKFLRDRSN